MRGSDRKNIILRYSLRTERNGKKRPFFPMIPFSKPDLTLTCAGRQGKLPAMRIVFMGTGDIAIPAFRSLIRHSDLAGLVTQPDRPVGRHQVLQPRPSKILPGKRAFPCSSRIPCAARMR